MDESDATMNAALQRRCAQIRTLLSKGAIDEVEARYRIGLHVVAIMRSEDKYGARAVERVAAALGKSAPTLYRYASVPQTWPRAQMRALAPRKNRHGEPLSWSHWVELAKVQSPSRRDALLHRCLREALSVAELAKLTRNESDRDRDDDGAPTDSPSMRAAIVEMAEQAERWSSQLTGDIDAVVDWIRSNARSQDAEMILVRAIRSHEQLRARLERRLVRLGKARSVLSEARNRGSSRSVVATRAFLLAGSVAG